MGLAFLAPLFLLGLAALAVPIVVHLIHRERRDPVAFPSLMFLRRIPHRSARRRRIRHWPLFLVRCLALALLVAAFARPFFARREAPQAAGAGGARELVILLDRSYSMGYGDRWARALGAARRAVDGLRPGDRATLVFFADAATAATQATADRATLHATLDAARVGSGGTRYAPALRLAQRILAESALPRREAVLITDFQQVGWRGDEEVRLPAGASLTYVDLSEREPANVSVARVDLERELVDGRERVTASARLTNKGSRRVDGLPVALELNGRTLQTRTVSLAPNSAATVAFEPVALPEGSSRGTVRAEHDALAADDAFHFVLSRGQELAVLLVEHPEAPAARSLYLARALRIGDRPPFRVTVKRLGELGAADVAGRSLVILNDAGFPAGDVGRRLAEFVRAGGGLVVALGDRSAARGWPAGAEELVPAPAAPVDRSADRGGTIGYLDRGHPVFEIFGAPRSGDWAAPRFFRYRPVAIDGAAVLARFDDGAPALVERRVGKGRVLVWASTLDSFWNDLPVQPVFLPFVHQLAKYAAGYAAERPWYTAGQVLDVAALGAERDDGPTAAPSADAALVAVTPSGERVRVAGGAGPRAIELVEQGFYELRLPTAGGARTHVVAVNLDLAEADLSSLDPEELTAAVRSRDGGVVASAGAAPLGPAEREQRQSLWRYLLATALLLLAAETALSNRLSRGARARPHDMRASGPPGPGPSRPAAAPPHAAPPVHAGRADAQLQGGRS